MLLIIVRLLNMNVPTFISKFTVAIVVKFKTWFFKSSLRLSIITVWLFSIFVWWFVSIILFWPMHWFVVRFLVMGDRTWVGFLRVNVHETTTGLSTCSSSLKFMTVFLSASTLLILLSIGLPFGCLIVLPGPGSSSIVSRPTLSPSVPVLCTYFCK